MPKTRSAPPIRVPKKSTPTERVPRRVSEPSLRDYLEIMTRAIFQAGLSWAMIEERWPNFRLGFDGFEVARVAAYGQFDIERLMSTEGIVHSAKKIVGTIENAKMLIEIEREFGGMNVYFGGFATYADLFADAHRRFAFLGDLSCYYWLFRTGHQVPLFEHWIARQPNDHPRMREMVMAGRADDTSSEREGF